MPVAPHEILERYWGYSQFKGQQEQIISAILNGNDVLSILPTGAGKSICFQIPAIIRKGVCIVISPLVALMQDQVERLKSIGVPAETVHSGLNVRERNRILDNLHHDSYKLLYISPERIQNQFFKDHLLNLDVSFLCVDEAHCIDNWGRDFRPSYQQITDVKDVLPNLQIVAFTATAGKRVENEILSSLQMNHASVFRDSPVRNNLQMGVRRVENKFTALLKALNRYGNPAIVYVRNRVGTERVSEFLIGNGLKATHYHAGMEQDQRSSIQDKFGSNAIEVVVATTAFGMGIDKADIRTIIHLDVPESLESYVQETGRAGRDGKLSKTILYYQDGDVHRLKEQYIDSFLEKRQLLEVYTSVSSNLALATGSGKGSTHFYSAEKLAKHLEFNIYQFKSAVKILEQLGYWQIRHGDQKSYLHIIVSKESLHRYIDQNQEDAPLLAYIMRAYTGILSNRRAIDENKVARSIGQRESWVVERLRQLMQKNIVRYERRSNVPQLEFTTERLATENVFIDDIWYRNRREVVENEIYAMQSFLQTEGCRQRHISNYFDQPISQDCLICDNCIRKYGVLKTVKVEDIVKVLKNKRMPLAELEREMLGFSRAEIRQGIQWLLEQELIQIENGIIELR